MNVYCGIFYVHRRLRRDDIPVSSYVTYLLIIIYTETISNTTNLLCFQLFSLLLIVLTAEVAAGALGYAFKKDVCNISELFWYMHLCSIYPYCPGAVEKLQKSRKIFRKLQWQSRCQFSVSIHTLNNNNMCYVMPQITPGCCGWQTVEAEKSQKKSWLYPLWQQSKSNVLELGIVHHCKVINK